MRQVRAWSTGSTASRAVRFDIKEGLVGAARSRSTARRSPTT
jgi:hypothetical protein